MSLSLGVILGIRGELTSEDSSFRHCALCFHNDILLFFHQGPSYVLPAELPCVTSL
jgi:hypothetical protein